MLSLGLCSLDLPSVVSAPQFSKDRLCSFLKPMHVGWIWLLSLFSLRLASKLRKRRDFPWISIKRFMNIAIKGLQKIYF